MLKYKYKIYFIIITPKYQKTYLLIRKFLHQDFTFLYIYFQKFLFILLVFMTIIFVDKFNFI